MPGLMRVFTGTDDLATFAPLAPGQEQWAREASQYVPHVLMRQNDGFRIVSALLKDAVMFRLGVRGRRRRDHRRKRCHPSARLSGRHRRLDRGRAEAQGATPAVDDESDGANLVVTHPRKRVVVESISPEDIRFSPAAREEDK